MNITPFNTTLAGSGEKRLSRKHVNRIPFRPMSAGIASVSRAMRFLWHLSRRENKNTKNKRRWETLQHENS